MNWLPWLHRLIGPREDARTPMYPAPDYTDDIFFGIRWRWHWIFQHRPTRVEDWHPNDVTPYCRRCDIPLEISDLWEPERRTEFYCSSDGCRPLILAGDSETLVEQVVALIEREALRLDEYPW
jgi:hypothetical protein